MDVYRVTYKQIHEVGRSNLKLPFKDRFTSEAAPIMDDEYFEHTTLIIVPIPSLSVVEDTLRQYACSKDDEHHWLYVTSVNHLGNVIPHSSIVDTNHGEESP
jgi:hypothetical protein